MTLLDKLLPGMGTNIKNLAEGFKTLATNINETQQAIGGASAPGNG